MEDYKIDTDCVEDSIVLHTLLDALKESENVCGKKKEQILTIIKSFLDLEYAVVEAERKTIVSYEKSVLIKDREQLK